MSACSHFNSKLAAAPEAQSISIYLDYNYSGVALPRR